MKRPIQQPDVTPPTDPANPVATAPAPQRHKPFHGGYVSDFEQFLNNYLAQHPQVVEDRQRGWNIWWDHRVDLDELDKQRADSVARKPYHYE